MKFNFRKISAVLTSGIMVVSGIGFAAAASFPSPYSASTSAGVAIVTGTGTGVDDTVAASSISNYLAGQVQTTGVTSVTEGDFIKFEKDVNKFNLGEGMADFYTKLDEDELSVALAEGIYSNDANDEFDYEQEIKMGTLTLSHFLETDSDFSSADVPVIGFDLADGTTILNYTLKFSPDKAQAGGAWVAGNDLESTEITMLGRTYYLLSARNTTTTNSKLTLLDTANSGIITEGETLTLSSGGVNYAISIEYISSDEIMLDVNGVQTNKLAEGGVYKIAEDTYIAVKSNLYNSKTGEISKAEVSIGTGKIEIENLQEVKINNEDVSDVTGSRSLLNGYITRSGAYDLEKVVLEWKLDDTAWIIPGEELVLPGFETIKISMGGFNVESEEVTKVEEYSGIDGSIRLSTEIEEGDVNLDLLYINTSGTGFAGLGEKPLRKLVTNVSQDTIRLTLNETENSYFVVTRIDGEDYESYAFEIKKISEDSAGNNVTELENLADGTKDMTLDEITDDDTKGGITFTLISASDSGKTAVIELTRSGGNLYTDRLVTEDGLQFRLPQTTTAGTGLFNTSANNLTWDLNITEESRTGSIAAGATFKTTIGIKATEGAEPQSLTGVTALREEDDSDNYIGYVTSVLATKVLHYKPSGDTKQLTITYHDTEAYADVFLTEFSATVGGGEVGSMVFTDAETTSWQSRDVILVGGSCINSATATALGVAYPTCEAAFTTATGIGSGQYLIQSIAGSTGGVVDSGKIALVVAGYSKADTAAAASRLANLPSTIDTTAGSKYLGVVGVEGVSTISKVA